MFKNPIIKNVVSSLSCQFVVLIYGLIIPKLIIENYGSSVNGLITSMTQFLGYIILLEAGLGPIIKNLLFKPIIEKNKQEIESILGATSKFFKRISYVLLLYLIILCFLFPVLVKDSFSSIYTISLLIIIAISTFSEYFIGMVYNIFLKSDQKNYIFDYANIITHILNILLIPILIKCGVGIHLVKLISAFTYVFRSLCLRWYFNKKYSYRINTKSDYRIPNKSDGLAHHIASVVQNNTDVVVLTCFHNLISVSIYNVYALIINGVRSIIVSLANGVDAYFGKEIIVSPDNVNKKFDLYSFVFFTLTTVILCCTIVLIIPFISVYTSKISDANYIQPLFAYILIFAEFLFVIRYPYSSLVYAKGDFKQTRNFSILEPIVNIVLSILFVRKYGLIGVAMGTLVSMGIRSFGFMIYASKHILQTKVSKQLKLTFLSLLELGICLVLNHFITFHIASYGKWLMVAMGTFLVTLFVIMIMNTIFYREYVRQLLSIFWKRGGKRESK